jgi:hypothetical protein
MLVTLSNLTEALLWPSLFILGYIITCAIFTAYQADFKRLYIMNPPYTSFLQSVMILHNTGLILYSASTMLFVTNELYYGREQGPTMANLCWLFTYSKIWEFLDTYLILAKGQPTIFLQKYHHIGALLCWWLCCYYNSSQIYKATLYNACIHTLMYSYYLASLLGYKWTLIKPYITSLQLLQFIICTLDTLRDYSPKLYTKETLTDVLLDGDMMSTSLFYVYVAGLIILFVRFFIKAYL